MPKRASAKDPPKRDSRSSISEREQRYSTRAASQAGRELKYLTDFFPDQVDGGTGRLTRSKARSGAVSPSSTDQAGSPHTMNDIGDDDEIGAGNVDGTRRSKKHARRSPRDVPSSVRFNMMPGPSSSSASSSDAAPVRMNAADEMADDYDPLARLLAHQAAHSAHYAIHAMPVAIAPPNSTNNIVMSNGDPRLFPGWDLGGMGLDPNHDPAAAFMLGGPVSIPAQYITHGVSAVTAGLNQIPVIQPPQQQHPSVSGVPIALSGMLFDPLSSSGPGGSHSRTISRSAASQFIHGLVPRMQHLLGGHKSVPQDSRVSGIMEGLKSSNEMRQSEAATELAEWLLMANEDNLPSHLPIRDITHALISLLQKEHNFELMLTAARCLRNLLEAVPRSQPIVVDAVPYLLEKLKRIECVDVAEQALTALEELSKRSAKTILSAGGIAACMSHVDFFSITSQRLAFSIASNCAMYLSSNDFPLVRDSLSELTERLLIDDKRCLESVCQLFSRLVENLKNHPDKLREVAGSNHRLLALMQQHLMSQPSQLSSATFSSVVRMLRTLASKCPDLAAALIRMDYQSTLRSLFTGQFDSEVNEIMERPPNQLQDMVYLVGELFPRLPSTGIFEIDSVFTKPVSAPDAFWFWQDDDAQWQAFRTAESRALEAAKANGQASHDMAIGQQFYRVDLGNMTQRNVATGNERPVQRRETSPNKIGKAEPDDGRLALMQSEPDLMERVVSTLFPILVAIDGSSSGPALRFECLRVMLRMVCPVSAPVLRTVLSNLPLSGHIASALASPRSKDLSIVVAALQMVHLLLEKMSDIYSPLFLKEGVAHEVQKLAAVRGETKSAPASAVSTPAVQAEATPRVTRSHRNRVSGASLAPEEPRASSSKNKKDKEPKPDVSVASGNSPAKDKDTPSTSRQRKRASPEGSPAVKKEKESRRKSSGLLNALRIPGIGGLRPSSSSTSSSPSAPATPPASSSAPAQQSIGSYIAQMAAGPSGSRSRTAAPAYAGGLGIASNSAAAMSNNTKEKLRIWIKKEAELLLKTYLSETASGGSVIDCLAWVSEQLRVVGEDVGTTPLTQLHDILQKDSVSAFEMTHSGVIGSLHHYLVSEDPAILPHRKLRLKRFAAVFMHLTADNLRPTGEDGCFSVYEALISKTLASVAQLEQFQVKVNDMGGIATGSSGCLRGAHALRFFQNHQMKCSLRRHPACRDLRDYHRHGGSTIKVDPLTSISAIEKYLVDKGIGRVRQSGEESSGDDVSDEEDALVAAPPGTEERRIEIVLNEHALPSQMSVLQALRQYSPQLNSDDNGSVGNSLWMTTHVLYYRSAEDATPPPSASGSGAQPLASKDKKHRVNDKLWSEGEVETMLSPLWSFLESHLPRPVDDPCVPSLLLLRALHGLNRYWHGLFDEEHTLPSTYSSILPASSFHSTKLAAKLQRQLSDFISVATQQIPAWTVDLGKAVPFLFPFSLRRSLLYCTSFGRDRALMHLVSQSEGAQGEGETGRLTPRLERKKIVVRRDDLLRTAESALATNATSRAMLEVSFEGEAGTGFGPTLEFYSTVSRELQNAVHKLWHGTSQKDNIDDDEAIEYMIAGHGLYPTSQAHTQRKDAARVKKFELLGRLMGQALVDCRMLDLPLSPVFLHWLVADPSHLGVAQMEMLDPGVYSSLRQLTFTKTDDFEHLEMYFTLPGNESFELMKNGRNIQVNKDNVQKFIKLVSWWRLAEGVWRDMEAVKKGFSQVVDPHQLSLFLPEELDQLFCGCSDGGEKIWGELVIAQAIKPDHGYTHDSDQIRWLIAMLSSFSLEDQRRFVQFVTGSPRLPVGGFRALNPPLTVVRKTAAYGSSDEELPSAMTCYNYLKVPAYSSYEVFRERFSVALQFIYSFHLT